MATDKELKALMKRKARDDPDAYYATKTLRRFGYTRSKCSSCDRFFWSTQERDTCDDAECAGGFRFIGNTPATHQYDYIQTWQQFAAFFKKKGYTPIERYPVVARWRNDTDWVQASIYDFQPYVVSGEVAPPANPLVIPQLCLRFNDIDNVGITGSHNTCFVMVGQHAFVENNKWNHEQYFEDLFLWFTEGLGIPKEELVLHEDGWAGGGNLGPCMEFFSRGLELCNQVYMMYEDTPDGIQELPLRVLDMGLGLERNAWFSTGSGTSYDAVFPTVMNKLRTRTGLHINTELQQKFLPFAAYLNIDEVENIDHAWNKVAAMVGVQKEELRSLIEPLAALYAIAEHARALLVALTDGALPSNVGSMYNLRVLLRRALGCIDRYKWNIDLFEVCTWHAAYLKPLFPELSENLDNVEKILAVETQRYKETQQRSEEVLKRILKKDITTQDLIDLYDTQGIAPQDVADFALQHGKTVTIPDNFYARVTEKHKQPEQITQTERSAKLPLEDVPDTKILYFKNYLELSCTARVQKILGNHIILDQSCFYPTSGGQLHDVGTINDQEVIDVYKQGSVIVHVLQEAPTFKSGDTITCKIDKDRRVQLAQHHTATHIIGHAARHVLGHHCNQASAKKDIDKAHIDITHYEQISRKELEAIEEETNRVIESSIPIHSTVLPRTEAEQTYGTRIYQGGAVPGRQLRIVEIEGVDAQACGGTHVHNTQDVVSISILKSSKVKDGVVRIFFVAGKAKERIATHKHAMIAEWADILGVNQEHIVSRATELFTKWKKARKAHAKKKPLDEDAYQLTATEPITENISERTASALGTQPEHVGKTLKRFLHELEQFKKSSHSQ